ncbi:MAG TPA: peptide ABC transporter substrate-binding protein [Dehalococcoidia bacterium]|nr:peptide ABC transporter substrate-binding protein [Dehalococcoidia bacterium]
MTTNQDWQTDPEQMRLFAERLRGLRLPRRDLLRIVAAAGGAAMLAACGGGAAPSGGGSGASTNSASGGKPAAADLAKDQTYTTTRIVTDPSSWDYNKNLYNGSNASVWAWLLQYDPDFNVVPDIAEKYDVSADGTVYTFHLRDSKWSNGEPVTAADFEYSYKRQLDPATGAAYAGFLYDIKNGQAFNQKKITDAGQVGVKALDPKTVQITLEGPRGFFPALMAFFSAAPSYRPAVEKFGDKWTEAANIVCNGPFKLTKWEHSQQAVLEKNPGYWNAGNITLTKVVLPIIPYEQMQAAYENNEVDNINQVQVGNLKRIQADPKMSKELFKYPSVGTWYVVPSVTIPPFDNLNARLAVAHAIDRDKIVNSVIQGTGEVTYTFNPKGTPFFNPNTYDQYTKYDPKMAMDLLKGTPYEGGKNWPKITLTNINAGDAPNAAADAIIQMLKDNLGMTIDHETGDRQPINQKMYNGQVQLMWISWLLDYPDANDTNFLVFYGKTATGHRQTWKDDQYDALVTKAAGELDPQKRIQMYQQADEMIAKQGVATFVYNSYYWDLRKPWVVGLPKNKAGQPVPYGNMFLREFDRLSILKHD